MLIVGITIVEMETEIISKYLRSLHHQVLVCEYLQKAGRISSILRSVGRTKSLLFDMLAKKISHGG